jgi:hypothetical protein
MGEETIEPCVPKGHRAVHPAIQCADGTSEWYRDGIPLTRTEIERITAEQAAAQHRHLHLNL